MTVTIETTVGTFVSNNPKLEGVEGRVVDYGGRGNQPSFLVGKFSEKAPPEIIASAQLHGSDSRVEKAIRGCLGRAGFRPAENTPN